MNKTQLKQKLSLILCIVLIAAMALFTAACNDKTTQIPLTENTTITVSDGDELGDGETKFTFIIADIDGTETTVTIHTDETIVGRALLDLHLIAGEEGEFGLYVKTVNGIMADYDTTGTYWAFYVDGEYGMSGVDTTEIIEGSSYALKVEK